MYRVALHHLHREINNKENNYEQCSLLSLLHAIRIMNSALTLTLDYVIRTIFVFVCTPTGTT